VHICSAFLKYKLSDLNLRMRRTVGHSSTLSGYHSEKDRHLGQGLKSHGTDAENAFIAAERLRKDFAKNGFLTFAGDGSPNVRQYRS
jgi:hypothetical protein